MAFKMQSVKSIFFGFQFTAITIFKDLFYNHIISDNMSRIKKVGISTYSFYFSQDKFFNY